MLPYISTIICRHSLEACNHTIHWEKKFIVQGKVNYWSYFPYVKSGSRIQSTFTIIKFKYKDCGVTGTWKNREMAGSMPSLNLLLSAGLSISGIKIQFYSKKKFFRICVLQYWNWSLMVCKVSVSCWNCRLLENN